METSAVQEKNVNVEIAILVNSMSQVKTKGEINNIKKACKYTDAIFSKICARLDLAQMTEIELKDFILSEIKKKKLKPSFSPIVISGIRAGNEIHPKPTSNKLVGFVIVDFGVRYNRYCSDMTRMLFIGKPKKTDLDIYKKLLNAQILGIENSKINTKCFEIDHVVRESLGKYKSYFIHTLGHGVGMKIHEKPILYYKATKPVLKENMVITIEPGIYIKDNLGMRIEDTILITKKGPQILTKSTKELIVIKA